MFILFGCVMTLIGATLFYGLNKNQRLFNKQLSKKLLLTSLTCFVAALSLWLMLHSTTAAIFIWLFVIMLMLICLPFLTLLKSRD